MTAPQEHPETPLRPLTGGAVMATVSRVTVALTGAATTIFVARLLGPEGSGGFAIALTIVLMLTVLCSLGIEHGIAYHVASGRWAARDALRSVQRVALLSGLLGAALCVLARLAVPQAFGGLSVASTATAALTVPFALSWFYVSFVGLAIDRYEAYVAPPAMQSALTLVLVVALALAAGLRARSRAWRSRTCSSRSRPVRGRDAGCRRSPPARRRPAGCAAR